MQMLGRQQSPSLPTSCSTHSRWPLCAASCSGVAPLRVLPFTKMPSVISQRQTYLVKWWVRMRSILLPCRLHHGYSKFPVCRQLLSKNVEVPWPLTSACPFIEAKCSAFVSSCPTACKLAPAACVMGTARPNRSQFYLGSIA